MYVSGWRAVDVCLLFDIYKAELKRLIVPCALARASTKKELLRLQRRRRGVELALLVSCYLARNKSRPDNW